jgi:hypothetical protein
MRYLKTYEERRVHIPDVGFVKEKDVVIYKHKSDTLTDNSEEYEEYEERIGEIFGFTQRLIWIDNYYPNALKIKDAIYPAQILRLATEEDKEYFEEYFKLKIDANKYNL